MRKINMIIILILSIFILIIKGCGVMSNPKDRGNKELRITESTADAFLSTLAFEGGNNIVQLFISETNSEFISILGDDYKIFENNNSFQVFITLLNEENQLLQKKDKLQIEHLLTNLKSKVIHFNQHNLLFFPFRTKHSYYINSEIKEFNQLFSIKLDLNETFFNEVESYNILFYEVDKDVNIIKIKEDNNSISIFKVLEDSI